MKMNFRFILITGFILCVARVALASAGTIEVIAVRHGESLNNILSQKKSPISFFIAAIQQRASLSVTESLFRNPLLSTEGKNQARLLHDTLFPNNSDPLKLLSSNVEGRKAKLFVSPLNRTIQTALIVFGEQLYKSGVEMVAEPSITEHRKSISEDGYKDAARPISLFDHEVDALVEQQRISVKERTMQRFKGWETRFKESLRTCCDEKEWWPKGPVETTAQMQDRIKQFKNVLKNLPDNTRVVLVSHGTFLRTLFFGVDQMENQHLKIRNTGMLIGKFDKETGNFVEGSVSCFDPKTGKSATGLDPQAVCFDKVERSNSFVVEKGPVYPIDETPPYFGGWQIRQLNIFKHDGVVGVTWTDKGATSTTKVKGAALVLGETENCEFPNMQTDESEKMCLIIQRVKVDKENGPVWETPETSKWEVLRLKWPKSDKGTTQALTFKNLLQ